MYNENNTLADWKSAGTCENGLRHFYMFTNTQNRKRTETHTHTHGVSSSDIFSPKSGICDTYYSEKLLGQSAQL